MINVIILIVAWTAIWGITWVLPPISPSWLPFLPVLYPTYALIIRRRKPGVQRSIAAALTILVVWIDLGWAMSYAPKTEGHLFGAVERGRWRFEVSVYEGRCYAEYWDLQGQTVHRPNWRLPVWTLLVSVAAYPALVLWREARRRRDHVRDTCLICTSAAILFVGILAQLVTWVPATYTASRATDPVLDVLVLPPGFSFLGTVVGAFWSAAAVLLLRRRSLALAAKSILLTMLITAVICSICALLLPTEEILWVLEALVFGSVVFLVTCQLLRRRLPILYPTGHCHRCGYDLTGNVSGVCPECGEKVQRL